MATREVGATCCECKPVNADGLAQIHGTIDAMTMGMAWVARCLLREKNQEAQSGGRLLLELVDVVNAQNARLAGIIEVEGGVMTEEVAHV